MSSKLNILFLSGWYPSRVLPNNGDFIQRHAEAVNTIHKVTVLHIISDINCKKNMEYTFNCINGVDTHIAYIKPTKNPLLKSFRFFKSFKILLKKIGDFDLVHLNILFPFGIFALYLKWFKNKNFIVTEHWTDYHQPQVEKLSKLQLFISQQIVKNAQFICPVSKELQYSMEAIKFQGDYKIVHNIVDTDIFYPNHKTQNSIFTILHISNMLDEHKNVSGIIKAVAKLNFEYQLILIGENSSKYKSVSDQEGITDKIQFINHVPHKNIPDFLRQANLYISYSNYETWGIVMVEALACGTPVISTDTGVLYELNLKEFATIIKKNDEQALIKAILKYQQLNYKIDENKIFNFVKNNFSITQVAKDYSTIYNKAIK